jgi:hypothetical protein
MTIDDLIQTLRAERNGPHRRKLTDLIHEIERFSLGTEVDVGTLTDAAIKGGNFKFALDGETLVLRK